MKGSEAEQKEVHAFHIREGHNRTVELEGLESHEGEKKINRFCGVWSFPEVTGCPQES